MVMNAPRDANGEIRANYAVVIDYVNYRGERRERVVYPITIAFMATLWHPEPQWCMLAYDDDKNQLRWFAMKDVRSWRPE